MAASTSSVPPHAKDGASAAPVPAYASAPRRSGLLYALAGIIALAAAGAMAMFLFGGRPASMPAMTASTDLRADDARKAMDAAKAALDEASRSVLQPSAPSARAIDSSAPPAAATSADASTAPAATPSDKKPAPDVATPAAPPAPEAPRVAAVQEPVRVAPKPEPPRPSTRPAAPLPGAKTVSPVPSPAPVVVAAAPPAQAMPDDRWVQMRQEMDRCSSSSLIPRFQCERRILTRYCDGYWGSVPSCPTGRQDHGN